MIPNGTAYANFPSFANNGTKTPPGGSPESAKYALGMVPADTFPAEWANYLFHGATAGITRLNLDTGSIKKELNTILSEYGITNDASAYNQLVTALSKIFPQVCTCETAAATTAKSVALTGYTRKVGAIYSIEMTYGNSAASPTLTINSDAESTAPICDSTGHAAEAGAWQDGDVITVLYTGTKYIMSSSTVNKIARGNMNPVASNAVSFISASTTTITGPLIGNGGIIKVLFTSAITGTDSTSAMSINYNGTAISVKVNKNGTLSNFVAKYISSSYKYLQAYTLLELLYDGTNFIIVGNPIVLSSADYTIYADGKVGDEAVGTVKTQATTDIPYGWLECNGQTVSRTTYKPLFDKFNSQSLLSVYGVGNGATTFNVPDYSETSLVGRGQNVHDTIATHDTYTIGQFKDDQLEGHIHYIGRADNPGNIRLGSRQASVSGSGIAIATWKNGAEATDGITYGMTGARYDNNVDVTHGKQKGVIYIIKAL